MKRRLVLGLVAAALSIAACDRVVDLTPPPFDGQSVPDSDIFPDGITLVDAATSIPDAALFDAALFDALPDSP